MCYTELWVLSPLVTQRYCDIGPTSNSTLVGDHWIPGNQEAFIELREESSGRDTGCSPRLWDKRRGFPAMCRPLWSAVIFLRIYLFRSILEGNLLRKTRHSHL